MMSRPVVRKSHCLIAALLDIRLTLEPFMCSLCIGQDCMSCAANCKPQNKTP